MKPEDRKIVTTILETCNNSELKDWAKIEGIIQANIFVKSDKIRCNINQIIGLNPSVFKDKDIVFMVKDFCEMVLLCEMKPKPCNNFIVNFRFIIFGKPIHIKF